MTKKQKDSMMIDDVEWVRKDSIKAREIDNNNYVIVRSENAGVHAGYLKSQSKDGKLVVLDRARRIWKWVGAASLSQLAMEGVKKPSECKFPCEMETVTLTEAIEVIPCTNEARDSIQVVPVWQM